MSGQCDHHRIRMAAELFAAEHGNPDVPMIHRQLTDLHEEALAKLTSPRDGRGTTLFLIIINLMRHRLIGATGGAGQAIVRHLRAQGHVFTVLFRSRATAASLEPASWR